MATRHTQTLADQSRRPHASGSSPGAALVAVGLVALVSLAGFPFVLAIARTVRWALDRHPSAGAGPVTPAPSSAALSAFALVSQTLIHVAIISVLAAILAIPSGWLLSRARSRRHAAMIAVPLFMPSYLAYAGWGLLRAPRTALGDWLSSGSNAGVELKFLIANHASAIWGLALWSYPIAAFTMAICFERVSRDLLDALSLDRAGRFGHRRVLARMGLPGFFAAAALVSLVMLGSVVPLDVAQVNTYSIHLLRLVTERQHIEEAWASAWPVYALAVVAAAVLTSRVRARPADDAVDQRSPFRGAGKRARRSMLAAAALVWLLATLVPFVLFILYLRGVGASASWRRALQLSESFWRESLPGVIVSTRVSAVVAALGVTLALAAWFLVSTRLASRRAGPPVHLLRLATFAFVVMGLLPGVFTGSAIAQAWTHLPAWLQPRPPWLLVALAHLARFGFIALLVGWWIARQESSGVADLRRLDGAVRPVGWLSAVFLARWPHLLGVAAALFALSFHEIEATVLLQPPGPQALSQQLLGALHFARDDVLAAAVVNLLAFVGILGAAAGWLLSRSPVASTPLPRRPTVS